MKKIKVTFIILFCLVAFVLLYIFLQNGNIQVLNPKGWVAERQRSLIIISALLMLIVVVPVFWMTFYFVWKYRAGNSKAKYSPDWDNNNVAELIWWGFPFAIVVALSILAYKSSHELDPFKPLVSDTKPITIQVVALRWKWLFIYPEQKIATINYIQFPEQTPLNFEITGDAPMNSFWIPQLGGQVYAMPGMRTKLHLIANELGSFRGSSANLSGTGFSGMTFTAKSSSQEDFDAWVSSAQSSAALSSDEYEQLVKPTSYHPVALYTLQDESLFDTIVMKYMYMKKE